MPIRKLIQEDIRSTIKKYRERNYLTNTNLPDKAISPTAITFNRTKTGIDKTGKYIKNFLDAYNSRDYICTLFDNSMIQASFEFRQAIGSKRIILYKGILAYYPNPGLEIDDLNDLLRCEDEDEAEEVINIALAINDEYLFSSNYVRIEFSLDDEDYTEILHPSSHIHIGANNSLRLALERMPLFSEFMDFIFFAYYQDFWVKMIFDLHPDASLDNSSFDFSEHIKTKRAFIRDNCIASRLTNNEKHHYLVSFGTSSR